MPEDDVSLLAAVRSRPDLETTVAVTATVDTALDGYSVGLARWSGASFATMVHGTELATRRA